MSENTTSDEPSKGTQASVEYEDYEWLADYKKQKERKMEENPKQEANQATTTMDSFQISQQEHEHELDKRPPMNPINTPTSDSGITDGGNKGRKPFYQADDKERQAPIYPGKNPDTASPIPKNGFGKDLLLLLSAFVLGLCGYYIGVVYIAPNQGTAQSRSTSSNPDETANLKQQLEALKNGQKRLQDAIDLLGQRTDKLESKLSLSPTIASPQANSTPASSQTDIENDLAKADLFLAQSQPVWNGEAEGLLLNLERDYAVKGLESIVNGRLRVSLQRMYDSYIKYLTVLGATDSLMAGAKLKKLQGSIEGITPSKYHTLTPEQRARVNGLAQGFSSGH